MVEEREFALELEGVSFSYPRPRHNVALKKIDLQIKQGEFVALIGQNGSGKSTLAKCTSGFLTPTKGVIRVCGKDIHKVPPSLQARYVGYVFQNPDHQLFKDRVWDDVAFGLNNLKVANDIVDKKVEKILKDLRLYQYRDIHPHRLAKGDKQRLAIASIVVMEPPVLLVDEPTTGQDPYKAREIMDVLTQLNERNKTTVLVITHSMELVAEYAKRTVALCQGNILLDGSVREVFSRSDILAKTFVEPPAVVQLAQGLGLPGVPLTTDEAGRALMEVLAK